MASAWQPYVDNNLVGTGNIKLGAIVGLNGGVWAKSPELAIGAVDTSLLNLFNPAMSGQSCIFAGEKYIILKADEQVVYAKKGKDGFTAAKTNQAVVMGKYVDPQQPGPCSVSVQKVADYLRDNGL